MEQHLNDLIMHYGYFGLILALAGGVVGLPLPDEILLTFVGYRVSQEYMSYTISLLSGFTGAAIGITLSYVLGLRLGLPILKKFGPKIGINEAKIQKTHNLFERFGPVLLVIGYFIPGVRHLTAYFAGISSLSLRKFFFFAYLGAFIWVSFFITLGKILGNHWEKVDDLIKKVGMPTTLTVLCVVVLAWFYIKGRKKTKQNRV